MGVRGFLVRLCLAVFAMSVSDSSTEAAPAKVRCADFLKRFNSGEKEARDDLERKLAMGMAKWFKRFSRLPNFTEFAAYLELSPTELRKYFKAQGKITEMEDLLGLSIKLIPYEFQGIREKMAKAFAKASKESMREVTEGEVATALGIPEEALLKFFGKDRIFKDYDELKALARELKPESFKRVIGDEFLSAESRQALLRALGEHKRIIYTSAVSGAPVNRKMFESLLNYAKRKDAIIVVRPINFETDGLDPLLTSSDRVFISLDGVILSPYEALSKTQVLAKMINPNRGLKRIGKRGQTQIIGSTKAHVDSAATEDNSIVSHQQISSGSLTDPNYSGPMPVQRRQDEIATWDHFMGAVIIERGSEVGQFHKRHIEYIAEKEGFVDLDTFYGADGTSEKVRAEAMVFGDVHVGDTDPEILKTIEAQIKKFRPKRIYLHDLFNGYSINRHEAEKIATLAAKAEAGQLSLKAEVKENQEFLKWLLSLGDDFEVRVVKSNHDLFLNKWLEDRRHVEDPYNVRFGSELFTVLVDGKDPLEYALRKDADFDQSRVKFLQVTDSDKVGPEGRKVELAVHGHAGPNGKPASITTLQEAADRIVVGHMHSNIRRNGTVVVGTFTTKQVSYNKDGSSSWVQSMAVVGENGEIQVLTFDDGQWYLEKEKDAAQEFEQGYPEMIYYKIPDGGQGQVDQYRQKSRY